MALVATTLSSECAADASSIVVASATGFAAGYLIRIDGEMMEVPKTYVSGTTIPVQRGQDGGVPVLHPSGAAVYVGSAADWGAQAPQTLTNFPIAGWARTFRSYSADGEIAMPEPGSDRIAVLNASGSTVLTMTIPVPTKDMDGCRLTVLSQNGTGAHVIYIGAVAGATSGTGLNGAGTNYDRFTFPAGPVAIDLFAYDSAWYTATHPAYTGTVTLLVGGIA